MLGAIVKPLDIAQWSDWLDAVLSVQTGFDDIRNARRAMQEDHQKLRQILEMEPSAQSEELNRYRARTSLQTWHRVGDRPISLLDGYEAMRAFLSAYWNRGGRQSHDIGMILGGLHRPEAGRGLTQWNNWLKAVDAAQAEPSR